MDDFASCAFAFQLHPLVVFYLGDYTDSFVLTSSTRWREHRCLHSPLSSLNTPPQTATKKAELSSLPHQSLRENGQH